MFLPGVAAMLARSWES